MIVLMFRKEIRTQSFLFPSCLPNPATHPKGQRDETNHSQKKHSDIICADTGIFNERDKETETHRKAW